MAQYLTFQEPSTIDGTYFWPGSQWEDFVTVGGGSSRTYTLTVDGVDYTGITPDQAFITDKVLPAETTGGMEAFFDRVMPHPDNGDYYKAVLRALDIDMRINHRAQYSGSDPKDLEGTKSPGKPMKPKADQ